MSSEGTQEVVASCRKAINEKRKATDELEDFELKRDNALLADLDETRRRNTNGSPRDRVFLEVYFSACRFLAPRSYLHTLLLFPLYALLQRYLLHTTSNLFNPGSIITSFVVAMLCLRGDVYKAGYKATRHLHDQHEHVSKAEYTVKVAGKRLKNYKSEWQSSRDRMKELEDDMVDTQEQLLASRDETRQVLKDSLKDHHRQRHNFAVAQLQREKLIVDELDKLAKKFKNVAVPKVKGVVPKKSSAGALTAPLERVVAGIRGNQVVLEKQVRLMEKMRDVLETEGAVGMELRQLLGRAENVMGQPGLRQVGGGDGGLFGAGAEVDFDEHYERLDAYHRELVAKVG